MFHGKSLGKNTYQYFTSQMNIAVKRRMLLETALRRAVMLKSFALHYQPQINLETGEIVGVEALVRWRSEDGTTLLPGDFIAVAEETGLINEMGEWVLREGCRQAKEWRDMGLPPLRMAINLSARQFSDRGFLEMVHRALDDTGFDPAWLEMEITESQVMRQTEGMILLLNQLSEMGIQIAIDDFGTGYSSLSYLKRLPIQKLKIDQSFVRDITVDPNDTAIVVAIINMARSLDLRRSQRGVETAGQLALLRSKGCRLGQGFLFSAARERPEPAAIVAAEQRVLEGACDFGRRLEIPGALAFRPRRREHQEYGRPLADQGRFRAPPGDPVQPDPLPRAGEIGRHGEASALVQDRHDICQQCVVPVWRLDEDLRLVIRPRLALQLDQRRAALRALGGKVTQEPETLSLEPARHQREHDGRGPGQGHDANALGMGCRHQQRTGIGDGGSAGFGKQPDVLAGPHRASSGEIDALGVCSFNSAMAISRSGRGWPHALRNARADFAFSTTKLSRVRMRSMTAAGTTSWGGRVLRKRAGDEEKAAGSHSGNLEAFGAQHGAERDQGEPDERGRIVAVQPRQQRNAQAFALRAARAIERGLALEIAFDLVVAQRAERDLRGDELFGDPRVGGTKEANRGMEEDGLAAHRAKLRSGIGEGAGLSYGLSLVLGDLVGADDPCLRPACRCHAGLEARKARGGIARRLSPARAVRPRRETTPRTAVPTARAARAGRAILKRELMVSKSITYCSYLM
jgi:EAL domain-containing protein (putative c-di-GMP-specific phosphodiesterase class I)